MLYLYNFDKKLEFTELNKQAHLPPATLDRVKVLTPIIEEIDNVYKQAFVTNNPKLHYKMAEILELAFKFDNLNFAKIDKHFSDPAMRLEIESIKSSLKKIYDIRNYYKTNNLINEQFIVYKLGEKIIRKQTYTKKDIRIQVENFFIQYDIDLNNAILAKAANPNIVIPKASPELIGLKRTLQYR